MNVGVDGQGDAGCVKQKNIVIVMQKGIYWQAIWYGVIYSICGLGGYQRGFEADNSYDNVGISMSFVQSYACNLSYRRSKSQGQHPRRQGKSISRQYCLKRAYDGRHC